MSELSIQHLLDQSATQIESIIGSDTARLDAELLLCDVLERERTYLFTWPEKRVEAEPRARFDALLARRLAGEPVAHLLGHRDFWSLQLQVDKSTLIPRPDTEVLVETVLQLGLADDVGLLDLGTGTGAIALALASECPQWSVTAVDFSADAVALAKRNRAANQLPQVTIVQSDWFAGLQDGARFDVIVSNPPYIDPQDPHLSQGDVRFEPLSALVAEEQGLADIRLIIDQARAHLSGAAWLVLEHGYDQGAAVRELMSQAGYQGVKTVQDYGAQDRVTLGCFKPVKDGEIMPSNAAPADRDNQGSLS